jgi:hypothetical protein
VIHTATLLDGRKLDVLRLQSLLEHAPVEYLPLDEIKGASRSPKSGFSRRRYERAEPAVAGIVDGRHRYLKRKDAGCRYMPVRFASDEQVNACVVGGAGLAGG